MPSSNFPPAGVTTDVSPHVHRDSSPDRNMVPGLVAPDGGGPITGYTAVDVVSPSASTYPIPIPRPCDKKELIKLNKGGGEDYYSNVAFLSPPAHSAPAHLAASTAYGLTFARQTNHILGTSQFRSTSALSSWARFGASHGPDGSITARSTIIAPSEACMPCATMCNRQLLDHLIRLNGTTPARLDTLGNRQLTQNLSILCSPSKPYDLGAAYGWFRAQRPSLNCPQYENSGYDEVSITIDDMGFEIIQSPYGIKPRRLWDLYSNRVIPYNWYRSPVECDDASVPNETFWAISHSWVTEADRYTLYTSVNEKQWPVPLPTGTTLEALRDELLGFGAVYVWLDVLCLRQYDKDNKANEAARVNEWRLDVPTIGNIYRQAQKVVRYYNGLGKPFQHTGWDDERHWLNRAWTLQEMRTWHDGQTITGGVAGDSESQEYVLKTVGEVSLSNEPFHHTYTNPIVCRQFRGVAQRLEDILQTIDPIHHFHKEQHIRDNERNLVKERSSVTERIVDIKRILEQAPMLGDEHIREEEVNLATANERIVEIDKIFRKASILEKQRILDPHVLALPGFISSLALEMSRRHATNQVDKVSGLAYLIGCEFLRSYSSSEDPESAWVWFVCSMSQHFKRQLLLETPQAAAGHWFPTWSQLVSETPSAQRNNDRALIPPTIPPGRLGLYVYGTGHESCRCDGYLDQVQPGVYVSYCRVYKGSDSDTYSQFTAMNNTISIAGDYSLILLDSPSYHPRRLVLCERGGGCSLQKITILVHNEQTGPIAGTSKVQRDRAKMKVQRDRATMKWLEDKGVCKEWVFS